MNLEFSYDQFKTKKGKGIDCFFSSYGRFLIAISIRAPTTAMAAIIAIPVPITYISVGGRVNCGCGVVVGAVGSTAKLVSEDDG